MKSKIQNFFFVPVLPDSVPYAHFVFGALQHQYLSFCVNGFTSLPFPSTHLHSLSKGLEQIKSKNENDSTTKTRIFFEILWRLHEILFMEKFDNPKREHLSQTKLNCIYDFEITTYLANLSKVLKKAL